VSVNVITSNVDFEEMHIGAELGAARTTAGLSLKDVGEELHIQSRYLDAIERLDKEALPSLGYALGYVRTYARFLGLNEQEAIARFKTDIEAPQNMGIAGGPHFVPKRSIRLPRGSMAIGAVLSCALVVVTWYGMKSDAQSAAPVVAPVILVENGQTKNGQTKNWGFEPVQPSKIDADMIALKAVGPSWVQVTDADGLVLISRIMVPGEIFETSRKNLPILSLRDAGAIELYLGGERIGTIGQRGQPAKNIPLAEVAQQ